MQTIPTLAALGVLMLASSCEMPKSPPFIDNLQCVPGDFFIDTAASPQRVALKLNCGGVEMNGKPLYVVDPAQVIQFSRLRGEQATCYVPTKDKAETICRFRDPSKEVTQ